MQQSPLLDRKESSRTTLMLKDMEPFDGGMESYLSWVREFTMVLGVNGLSRIYNKNAPVGNGSLYFDKEFLPLFVDRFDTCLYLRSVAFLSKGKLKVGETSYLAYPFYHELLAMKKLYNLRIMLRVMELLFIPIPKGDMFQAFDDMESLRHGPLHEYIKVLVEIGPEYAAFYKGQYGS